MSELPLSSDFESIVLNNTRLIDVRAPVEYEKGAFPNSVNLPLLNDEERRLIGIRYKEEGNAKAVELGRELLGGAKQEERTQAWLDFMAANPNAMLYCFRGGQRSAISQEWIHDNGKEITRLKGGYKAFRNYLMSQTEASIDRFKPIILGGRTGSGKTILLKKIANAIDLEGIANHRGSAFGRKITAQPAQIDFENRLAYELIQKLDQGFEHLVFEDEGKNVGSLYLPKVFSHYLSQAPRVILETPMQARVETTLKEYVIDAQKMYLSKDDPLDAWKEAMQNSIDRIKKRIGSERHKTVCTVFENALDEQVRSGSIDAYRELVELLLREYYDPMYDYQIQERSSQIAFRGSDDEVLAYLSEF